INATLIWEDLQYQINNRRSKVRRHAWITDEIKKSKAYKMYFKYSTGLIPPKKGRGEPKNRPSGRKKRIPRAVVIQEPPYVPVKKTQESSGKLKDLDEGAGTSLKVLDESEDKSKARDDHGDLGSTDDEEYLLAYKDEKPRDMLWQSTDDEESNIDEEEDESDE
nr:hypothetical protein [Tanacetum cinerariifolium]